MKIWLSRVALLVVGGALHPAECRLNRTLSNNFQEAFGKLREAFEKLFDSGECIKRLDSILAIRFRDSSD